MNLDSKYKSNPILFYNDNTRSLDTAYKSIIEIIEEYAKKNELSERQLNIFKDLLKEIYLEKRASYFIENKLKDFSGYINKALSFALDKSSHDDKENTAKVFYYNHKRHLLKHEQY